MVGAPKDIVHGDIEVIRIPGKRLKCGRSLVQLIAVQTGLLDTDNISHLYLGQLDAFPQIPQPFCYFFQEIRPLSVNLIISDLRIILNPVLT